MPQRDPVRLRLISVPPWWVCLAYPVAIAAALVAGCGGGPEVTDKLPGKRMKLRKIGKEAKPGGTVFLGRRPKGALIDGGSGRDGKPGAVRFLGRKPKGLRIQDGSGVAGKKGPGGPSLAEALARGEVDGQRLPPGSRVSGGSVDPIPEAPKRPPPRDAAEARARVLDDLTSASAHLRCLSAAAAGMLRLEEAVPELARLVRKDDPAASAAIPSLGMIGGERAAKALGSALPRARSTSFKVRIVRSLGRTRARAALKPLLRALDDGPALVRAEAATALGTLGMSEAAGALRGARASEDLPPTVRIAAASALARLGDPEGLAALERALASGSPGLGVVAIRGLAALVYLPGTARTPREPRSPRRPSLAYSDVLGALVVPGRRPASRASLPAADERLRLRAVEGIAAALGSPYAEVWSEALGAIAFLRPPGALRVLDALEQRASPRVRLRARLAKAAFGGHGSRRTLEDALLRADPHLRAASCAILGSSGDRAAVEALVRALDDPQASVRVAAARALGAIGGARAKQALERAAGREDAALEIASRRALGRIRWRERRGAKGRKPGASKTPGVPRGPAGQKRPAAQKRSAAQEKATGHKEATADPRGFRLERILTGAGGAPLCMIRRPDGRTVLLREGEDAGQGYLVERIVPRRGGGRVFLLRGDTVVTLDVETE